MQILRESVAGARSRIVLCDLNWRRLIYLRLAIAQMFDQPWAAEKLRSVKELTIVFHPEFHTTALLLVAWFASQLGWELVERLDSNFQFARRGAVETVEVKLQAVPGEWVSQVRIVFGQCTFDLNWSGKFLECSWSDYQEVKQLLPAGGTAVADLVNEELARGGEHVTYLRALDLAERLWA
jgi:glucose-6-phosphate dehydrogenase assembly protein OpcA